MRKKIKFVLSVLTVFLFTVPFLAACKKNHDFKSDVVDTATDYVLIEMDGTSDRDGQGQILIHLLPEYAPITVSNFKKLVGEHFYDGLTFHRVVDGFVIQAGDPLGTGFGGSKETIIGEFSENGIDNGLSHKRGVVSMARSSDSMNSASSQFFICNNDNPSLDGTYAAFGRVIYGMDEVDRIAKVEKDELDRPIKPVVMKRVCFISEEAGARFQ